MKHLARLFFGVLAIGIAFAILSDIESLDFILETIGAESNAVNQVAVQTSLAVFIGIIFYLISPWIITKISHVARLMLRSAQRIPGPILIIGSVGAVLGLIVGSLFSMALTNIPLVGPYLSLILILMLSYLGWLLAVGKSEEILRFFARKEKQSEEAAAVPAAVPAVPTPMPLPDQAAVAGERIIIGSVRKILDTSVIIDGRILDLCATGFLEGPLIVPIFVLDELRALADSADAQKRMRGRRGMDILNQIQHDGMIEVQIVEIDYPELAVDDKLLKLTQQLDGKLLTLDFNLSKICQLRKIEVLNINELANALRAVLLPGEEVVVTVIKTGKEPGQGVAYLEDGTMMVVEGGAKLINQTVTVVVTSALQTAAGRMIFARVA